MVWCVVLSLILSPSVIFVFPGPLSDMMNRHNSEPTFVVHSNRKKKAWPGPLGASLL